MSERNFDRDQDDFVSQEEWDDTVFDDDGEPLEDLLDEEYIELDFDPDLKEINDHGYRPPTGDDY